jgi:transcriptional regulator GlxA family with amidase domain
VVARVVVVGFEDMQALDLIGPLDVFNAASVIVGRPVYRTIAAAVGGGERRISCGLSVRMRDLRRIPPRHGDTVIVVGGPTPAVASALVEPELVEWLRGAVPVARRIASVCTGAFVLAAAGLLARKRVVTHWSDCDLLAHRFPDLTVDRDAIFVHDGVVWTSAGASAGMDMALAMVEDDQGRSIADKVAARLVLYMRRPGYQLQLSDALVAQATTSDPLGPAIAWARTNLESADIDALAHRAGLSLRTLHRRCLESLATTPAKLLDKLRVEHACTLLATTNLSAKSLAAQCGFGNPSRMNRAFERELGITPHAYRQLHAAS